MVVVHIDLWLFIHLQNNNLRKFLKTAKTMLATCQKYTTKLAQRAMYPEL